MSQDDDPEEMNDDEFIEADSHEVPPNDIVAFNELRSCADLYRLHEDEALDVEPGFQREFVWSGPAQTRFIDSLTKQLPIPSMCLAFDYRKEKWIAIDGRQRLGTIFRFLAKEKWRLSKLDDINPEISGQLCSKIGNKENELYKYYRRVSNTSIPINVLRCDFSKDDHADYVFTIFHRLNSGGTKLNNQEIRNCIYQGSLNDFLSDMDNNPDWRALNRMRDDRKYRRVKQEICLRFLAFRAWAGTYEGQIAKFLNSFMRAHQNSNEDQIEEFREVTTRTAALVVGKMFGGDEVPAMPTSVLEAMLVAISNNLDALELESQVDLARRYDELRANKHFVDDQLAEGLSKKDKVSARLSAATKIFS
ncbi:DUF262 domain-containing protein [Maricaulis maris]|jgi:hypothetical protein|uniref:DUF262 domain-containing protein n=1 Tax=Maricaulis maris TaxID=74318 RepID=UPI0026EECBAC|nr:DUF262 domain-containing protein [Maricaulis maris]